jgi:hypothetical protein
MRPNQGVAIGAAASFPRRRHHLPGKACELSLELGRCLPKREAQHQVLQTRIPRLDVLQVGGDLVGSATDPSLLLPHVLKVDAGGKVGAERTRSLGCSSQLAEHPAEWLPIDQLCEVGLFILEQPQGFHPGNRIGEPRRLEAVVDR